MKETIGHVDIRSGTLLVFDFGLIAAFAERGSARAAALAASEAGKTELPVHDSVNAVMARGIAPGRYAVVCERMDGTGAGLRRTVTIDFASGERPAARTVPLGKFAVECARIGVFDVDAVDHFSHSTSADGLADIAFWGPDEEEVARRFHAKPLVNGVFGVVDMPVAEAAALAEKLHALREGGELRFDFDLRPHNDHYRLLTRLRNEPTEAATIEIGGHAVCGFMMRRDGFFPAILELDAEDRPLRCVLRFDDNAG
jgi:hypothetical protein